jgi:hypothetical protein
MNTPLGCQPWQPWPLNRWNWWCQPVRAERLAALRIGLAAVMLLDVLFTYAPHATDFFGRDSLGAPELSRHLFASTTGRWSLLQEVENPTLIRLAVAGWALAAAGLLLGAATRLCAGAAWALSVSFGAINPSIDNAGDIVRTIVLFYLMLCPCGAVWSVDARLWKRPRPVHVHPWPLRLLFVQMVLIYFCNGIHKVVGRDWSSGEALYFVLGDWTLTRWSYAQVPVPFGVTRLLTWLVLGWELSFPLLVLWRPARLVALAFGAAFHAGIWVSLELGGFAPYMLCLYLPLLPWEASRFGDPPSSTDLRQGGPLDEKKVGVGHGDADAVVASVEVDGGVEAKGRVAGGAQAEQAPERRDAAGE